jgi:hypothetical protein
VPELDPFDLLLAGLDVGPPDDRPDDGFEPPIDRRLVLAVVVVVVALLAWLVVRLLTSEWLPIGDYRTLQLRVSDVGGSHTPLLGVYSRYQWNHPGPLVFYLLAIPYRLSGSNDLGLLFGALVINIAAIATALWIGARAGHRAFVLTGLFVVLLCVGMNPAGLADPWNPRFMVLAVFTTALGAWRTIAGDRVAALALVLWGSFAVQCHLGSALPIAVLVLVGLGALVVRSLRGPSTRKDRRSLLLIVGVALVCWIPPIIEQLTNRPGNMQLILDFLGDPPTVTTGPATGLRIVFRYLSIPGNWVRGAEPTLANYSIDTHGWAVPWALLALLAAGWWAWRRRWRVELAACGVALALVVAAAFAASRIVGAPSPYLLRWIWPIAAFTWMSVGLVALRQLTTTGFGRRHGVNLVVVATLVALVVMVPRGVDLTPLRVSESWRRTIEAVVPPTLEAIRDVDGPVWVSDGLGVDGSASLELIARAERAGLDVRRSPRWDYIIGEHRTIERLDAARELVFLTGDTHLELDGNPDYTEIASFDPRTPEERAAIADLRARHTADVDVTGLSESEARQARDEVFSAWALAEVVKPHPSQDFTDYWRLLQQGDLLTVFVSNGPPR